MAETRRLAQVVWVEYLCDQCGTPMRHTPGVALMSYPAQYPHECPGCKAKKNLLRVYPTYDIQPNF